MKKNNKILISELKYNRCQIKLDNIEVQFLYENIDFDNLRLKNIHKAISKLYESTPVRYFSRNKIKYIAINLYNDLKKNMNEDASAPARNIHTVFKKGKGNILPEDIVEKSVDITIDTHTGHHIVTFVLNKQRKVRRFNTEQEANLFVQQMVPKTF